MQSAPCCHPPATKQQYLWMLLPAQYVHARVPSAKLPVPLPRMSSELGAETRRERSQDRSKSV